MPRIKSLGTLLILSVSLVVILGVMGILLYVTNSTYNVVLASEQQALLHAGDSVQRGLDSYSRDADTLCGVLATDYNRFFIGTPQLPIPLPNTGLSFGIPEVPLFSKYERNAHGRFAVNIFEAKTRKPLEVISQVNSSALYSNWIVMLIPFSSKNLEMNDSKAASTSYQLFD